MPRPRRSQFRLVEQAPIAVVAALLLAVPAPAQQADWTPAQREVWKAAGARFDAWAENDYDAFQASTHERWSIRRGVRRPARPVTTIWPVLTAVSPLGLHRASTVLPASSGWRCGTGDRTKACP